MCVCVVFAVQRYDFFCPSAKKIFLRRAAAGIAGAGNAAFAGGGRGAGAQVIQDFQGFQGGAEVPDDPEVPEGPARKARGELGAPWKAPQPTEKARSPSNPQKGRG